LTEKSVTTIVTGRRSGHVIRQKRCHPVGPVDRRRLVQLRIDGLQAGQEGDRIEGHPAPDV